MNSKTSLIIAKILKIKNKDLNINYLEEEIIDSFEMIKFINKLESKFKIKFTQKDFENRKFTNIIGLSKIIEKKLK